MKKTGRKIVSIVLALVMLLGVCSAGLYAAAEESQSLAAPGIQTMLTDGKALKTYLETSLLNMERADILLSDNLPALAETLCGQLGDLFYQMGYNEADYPKDQESLMLALARVLGSLNAEVFSEPEKIETTDLSLVYNLAYLGGTEYIEAVNAALPADLRFDTSAPVLALDETQAAQVREYYAKWKAGDLRLDNFDIKDYLGDMTAAQYLKTVLLIFVADDARLPAISKKAVDFEIGASEKALLAGAIADILDNLTTAPVSAIVRVLANSDMHALLKALLETANKVTQRTDYYAYKLFSQGIYTDTDGSPIDFAEKNEDGTYAYIGPSMVSEYIAAADALFALLDGIDEELNESVLETVFSKRLDKLAAFADAALEAAVATISAQQNKLESDIRSAGIAKRVAAAEIEKIDSGAATQAQIADAQAQLDTLAAEIAALQEQLNALEQEELLTKEPVQGYYDTLAEFEASMSEETEQEILNDPAYIAAKQKVEQTEAALADNYASQSELKATIKTKTAAADTLAQRIADLESGAAAADAKAVYEKLMQEADAVLAESETALAALPEKALIDNVANTLSPLLKGFFTAFDGVYDMMLEQSPIKAAVALVYGLKDFVDAIENIDWDAVAPVTDPLFEQLDAYLDGAAGRYIGENGGANMLADLSAYVNNFLDTYGVYNYINKDYLNRFISEEILGDNSEIMKAAAGALSQLFGEVQPTYESIVSCLIPILSAFDFGAIMENKDNIGASLAFASPTAFAYLAGINSTLLDADYLNTVNTNLVNYGYKGSAVVPLISLSASSQSSLLNYVAMEKNGSSLEDIAAAGFRWENYIGSASKLAIANAFVKIALGDAAKLGEVASAPGLGSALVNLLCDLFDDIKTKPVDTLLKKVSDSESLAAIVDFAMGLLNGDDDGYKSFELFFSDNIYYDADGNTAFYAKLVDGNPEYTGPKAMEYYVPVIAALLDFLSGLDTDVENNGGDLLKALLYDKIPQLKQLIKSAISYEDNGEQKPGALFYLLLGYADYLKAENALMCYDLLIGLANADSDGVSAQIEAARGKIAIWQSYLEQVQALSDAAKLEKAKELGLADESATVYDTAAIEAAIAAKIATLQADLAALESTISADETALGTAQESLTQATEALQKLTAFDYYAYDDPFYEDLCNIFDDEDLDLIETLREDCEEDFNAILGEGQFDELVSLITEHLSDYAGDADAFMDDYIFGDGINYYARLQAATDEYNAADEAVSAAKKQLKADTDAYEAKGAELTELENGTVLGKIEAAGNSKVIYISDPAINADGEFNAKNIEEAIATITNEEIARYESEIGEKRALIDSYQAEQQAIKDNMPAFNPTLVPLATTASDVIAEGLINVIMGDKADGSENIYNYIMNHNVVDILTTGGRIASLVKMIVGIYEPALQALVSEGILNSETAAQLIAATPSFDSFYETAIPRFVEEFKLNPVGAAGALIKELSDTIYAGFAAAEGTPTHDVMQLKKVNSDISAIFDESFPQDWLDSYSKSVVLRTGEIYELIVDLLGLSFIKDLIGEPVGNSGVLSGVLDTAKLYSDAVVSLYSGDTLIASVEVKKDSDGAFSFSDVPEGRYVLKVETLSSVPYEIKAIDVIADETTDLAEHTRDGINCLSVPLGDVDGNFSVDIQDIAAILDADNYGSANATYDINCDGRVDISDVTIVLAAANYGAQATTVVY